MNISMSERQRLAAILGMLGSSHAGERDNAARQAEIFRRKHQLTWAELLALPPVEAEAEPEPAPAADEPGWTPSRAGARWVDREGLGMTVYGFAIWAMPAAFIYLIGLF